ncbi:MAG: cytochrome c family protein [Phycisphaerales bacterium]
MHRSLIAAVWASPLLLTAVAGAQQVQTTLNDFFIPGTQPNEFVDSLQSPLNCTGCHSGFDPVTAPYDRWNHSMMGQAGRDPIFYAALEVANNDVANVGELCLRCHVPLAWYAGNSVPTDGSAITDDQRSGVACIICHRAVDPIYQPGVSPAEDEDILNNLANPITNPHNASLVLDPLDRRRGPLDLGPNFFVHQWLQSPHHRSSTLCANCHEVSNPAYTRQPDGTYALNDLDTPGPDDKYDQFPIERTYSEWLMSDFALGPIDMGGRFGGTLTEVSSCQDCHMPQNTGQVCSFGPGRVEIKQHDFAGANTWVLRAVNDQFPSFQTGLTAQGVEESIQRNISMLQRAADLAVTDDGSMLNVRITNQSGHKLPTGYVEGRRMWINVVFRDAMGNVLQELGGYDEMTATLDDATTKVYEAKLGISPDVAAATGKPAGIGFHFALNNVWEKDNRIPPRGFTNAGFEAVQAGHVGYSYPDGQHWDDTLFAIPPGAETATVRVYYQTTSREYIEFLRDNGGTPGQIAYDYWNDPLIGNRSEPVVMLEESVGIGSPCVADIDLDGDVDLGDFGAFGAAFGTVVGQPGFDPEADLDNDGDVDLGDFGAFGAEFGRTDC